MIEALIFDMDGVIVDSNPTHREAWLAFNHQRGVPTTPEMLASMYGRRNDEIVREFFGAQLTAEQVFEYGAAKEALYREMIGPKLIASLVPGIREFLTKYQHLPIAVGTNAEPANVDLVLSGAGLNAFIRHMVDGSQVKRAKPDPEIYLRAAELLHTAPRNCVVFEDSFAGVAAGVAAGMPVIGIRTTHHDLPGTVLAVDDFLDPRLTKWMEDATSTSGR